MNRHFEVASFVGLLTGVMDKLEVAEKERLFLEENIEMVFQLVSEESLGLESYKLENNDCEKFLSRMNCSSVT
jgi:hypothetical protein